MTDETLSYSEALDECSKTEAKTLAFLRRAREIIGEGMEYEWFSLIHSALAFDRLRDVRLLMEYDRFSSAFGLCRGILEARIDVIWVSSFGRDRAIVARGKSIFDDLMCWRRTSNEAQKTDKIRQERKELEDEFSALPAFVKSLFNEKTGFERTSWSDKLKEAKKLDQYFAKETDVPVACNGPYTLHNVSSSKLHAGFQNRHGDLEIILSGSNRTDFERETHGPGILCFGSIDLFRMVDYWTNLVGGDFRRIWEE